MEHQQSLGDNLFTSLDNGGNITDDDKLEVVRSKKQDVKEQWKQRANIDHEVDKNIKTNERNNLYHDQDVSLSDIFDIEKSARELQKEFLQTDSDAETDGEDGKSATASSLVRVRSSKDDPQNDSRQDERFFDSNPASIQVGKSTANGGETVKRKENKTIQDILLDEILANVLMGLGGHDLRVNEKSHFQRTRFFESQKPTLSQSLNPYLENLIPYQNELDDNTGENEKHETEEKTGTEDDTDEESDTLSLTFELDSSSSDNEDLSNAEAILSLSDCTISSDSSCSTNPLSVKIESCDFEEASVDKLSEPSHPLPGNESACHLKDSKEFSSKQKYALPAQDTSANDSYLINKERYHVDGSSASILQDGEDAIDGTPLRNDKVKSNKMLSHKEEADVISDTRLPGGGDIECGNDIDTVVTSPRDKAEKQHRSLNELPGKPEENVHEDKSQLCDKSDIVVSDEECNSFFHTDDGLKDPPITDNLIELNKDSMVLVDLGGAPINIKSAEQVAFPDHRKANIDFPDSIISSTTTSLRRFKGIHRTPTQEPITLRFRVSPEPPDRRSDESDLNISTEVPCTEEILLGSTLSIKQPGQDSTSQIPDDRPEVGRSISGDGSANFSELLTWLEKRKMSLQRGLCCLMGTLTEPDFSDSFSKGKKKELRLIRTRMAELGINQSSSPQNSVLEENLNRWSHIADFEAEIQKILEYKSYLEASLRCTSERYASVENEMNKWYQKAVDKEQELLSLQDDINTAIQRQRDLTTMLTEERRLKESLDYQLQVLQEEKQQLLQDNLLLWEQTTEVEGKQEYIASVSEKRRVHMENKLQEMKATLRNLKGEKADLGGAIVHQTTSTFSSSSGTILSSADDSQRFASSSDDQFAIPEDFRDTFDFDPNFIEEFPFDYEGPPPQKFVPYEEPYFPPPHRGSFARRGRFPQSSHHFPQRPMFPPRRHPSAQFNNPTFMPPIPGGQPFWQSTEDKLRVYFTNLARMSFAPNGFRRSMAPRYNHRRGFRNSFSRRGRYTEPSRINMENPPLENEK